MKNNIINFPVLKKKQYESLARTTNSLKRWSSEMFKELNKCEKCRTELNDLNVWCQNCNQVVKIKFCNECYKKNKKKNKNLEIYCPNLGCKREWRIK